MAPWSQSMTSHLIRDRRPSGGDGHGESTSRAGQRARVARRASWGDVQSGGKGRGACRLWTGGRQVTQVSTALWRTLRQFVHKGRHTHTHTHRVKRKVIEGSTVVVRCSILGCVATPRRTPRNTKQTLKVHDRGTSSSSPRNTNTTSGSRREHSIQCPRAAWIHQRLR